MKFLFGDGYKNNRENNSCICVDTSDLYDNKKGYGFLTDKNAEIPGISNSLTFPGYYENENVIELQKSESGIYAVQDEKLSELCSENSRLIPVSFRADAPEYGNYRVRVGIHGGGEVLIYAGTRRLVYREILGELKDVTVEFVMNLSRIIPRGYSFVHERKAVYVTVFGKNVALKSIEFEKTDCPTIFICGDSTVTDQAADVPYFPGTSYSGWGQMLPEFLKGIAVSNHAHSGLTSETFRTEGHYKIAYDMMKKGDFIMFQFAHNDQKLAHLKAFEGYYENIVTYIKEAEEKQVNPILVTPLARNTWKADTAEYNDLLAEYAAAIKDIGEKYRVPVVDLHEFSMNEVKRDGLESSKRFYFPKDYTHTNDFGAYKMADFIAKALARFKETPEKYEGNYDVISDAAVLTRAKWEVNEIPQVPEIPLKFKHSENTEKLSDTANISVERPDDITLRHEALGFVIKTAKFFPTNVFNDTYDDIVGHETYAGTVECAYQNGIIPAGMITDKKFYPENPVTLEDFVCFLMGGYKSRRNLPESVSCSYDNKTHDYAREFVRAAVTLKILPEGSDLNKTLTRREAMEYCNKISL